MELSTRRRGPSFLTFDETQTTLIGVDQLTIHAFEMAVNAVKSDMLASTGKTHIGAAGAHHENLARLMSTSLALFDDSNSPPGTPQAPHVYGCYVMLPISLVDRAISEGQAALEALLLDGIDRAERQPESQDHLMPVSYAGSPVMVTIQDAFSEPAGKRAWRANIARRSADTPIEPGHTFTRAGDYLAAIAAGKASGLWEEIFGDEALPSTDAPLNYVECLADLPQEQAIILHSAMLRVGAENNRNLNQDKLIALSKLAAGSTNASNSGIRKIVDTLTFAGFIELDKTPQFGQERAGNLFETAAAMWNQGRGHFPNPRQALLLSLHFLDEYLGLLRKQAVQLHEDGDTEASWEKSSKWFNELPADCRTPEILKIADTIAPGMAGIEHFPRGTTAFLDAMFPKNKMSKKGAYPRPNETVVQATADHLLDLLKDPQHQAKITDYVMEAVREKGVGLDTLSQALERMDPDLDHYQRNRLMAAPQLALINEMNKHLKSSSVRHPAFVALLDEWWFKRAPNGVNSVLFEKSWTEWIDGNDEALLSLRLSSLTRWRRNELLGVAREAQEKSIQPDITKEQRKSPRM